MTQLKSCFLCGHYMSDHRRSVEGNDRVCYHGEFDRNPCPCRIPVAEIVDDNINTHKEEVGRKLSERMLWKPGYEDKKPSDHTLGFYDIAQALRIARIYQVPDDLPFAIRIDTNRECAPEDATIRFSYSGWMGAGLYATAPAGKWKEKWPDLY